MGLKRIIQRLRLRFGSEETVAATLREMGMRVGKDVRIYTRNIGSEPWLVRIGDGCVIAPGVSFVTHASNTPLQDKYESLTDFGKIDIREHSYIGLGAILLPNITIGPRSIVGAGSVVTRDVPPETVYAGNPARLICTLAEYEKKVVARHIDIPNDREAARRILEEHFWGDHS